MGMELVFHLEQTFNLGKFMIEKNGNHKHIYDKYGHQICCTQEEKINKSANKHLHGQDDEHDHDHVHDSMSGEKYGRVISSFTLFGLGLLTDHFGLNLLGLFQREVLFGLSYVIIAYPVFKEAFKAMQEKVFFSEFTLMGIATIGAMGIGEYPEGVAVMLFYSVGEIFQAAAVSRAKASIKSLLDLRSKSASVLRGGVFEESEPQDIQVGEIIQVLSGENVALDGVLESASAQMNTAAITGESAPRAFKRGERVLAGMINQGVVVQLKVDRDFSDSSISKILDMVQNASAKKAKTELLIRRFAKIYTPIVFFLAIGITLLPYFLVASYDFSSWLYRGLVFLVISCPCALVISIPLGYFGGIGAASRNGILFKGSTYIDAITKITHVVMDKTGTLTTGVFEVKTVETVGIEEEEFLKILATIESKSTHPIANAITKYAADRGLFEIKDVEEISGHGLKANVKGREVLAGNAKLLKKFGVPYPDLDGIEGSVVVVAVDGKYAGYVNVSDSIKEDAKETIDNLHRLGISTVMLSGDKSSVTKKVAKILGVDEAYGDLLPQDKVKKVEELKTNKSVVNAFVGDGINDAPVLALSDIGIAMGAMGSDAAIETANVVIQDDKPSKIVKSINIAKATRSVVIQNITFSFAVKVIVLILGAGGLATMWEAVFADVGVALLAILNAVRIQRMRF